MKKQIRSLSRTIVDIAKRVVTTGEIVEEKITDRLLICYQCPQYDPKGWCKLCGCYLKVKIKLAGAKCPLKKW